MPNDIYKIHVVFYCCGFFVHFPSHWPIEVISSSSYVCLGNLFRYKSKNTTSFSRRKTGFLEIFLDCMVFFCIFWIHLTFQFMGINNYYGGLAVIIFDSPIEIVLQFLSLRRKSNRVKIVRRIFCAWNQQQRQRQRRRQRQQQRKNNHQESWNSFCYINQPNTGVI